MGYATAQRRILQDVLEQHRDETFSVERLYSLIGAERVSRSALYRNLAALERQGRVKRLAMPGSNRTFYRYVDSETCRDHLHLSCSRCGTTIHLQESATDSLIAGVLQNAGFRIDSADTVLYGVCGKCRGN